LRRAAPTRRCADMPFRHLLIAVDGSEASNRALEKGLELARLLEASVTALAVEGPLPAYAATIGEVDEVKREKDAFFSRLAHDVRERGASLALGVDVEIRPGHAAELIPRVARERGVDLIVLGHRGHFLRDHLLGSTADRVAEHAECPVMIVK
jgi:nucleotide-binding universal stress UspA family protein